LLSRLPPFTIGSLLTGGIPGILLLFSEKFLITLWISGVTVGGA